ncbi:killer toxin [Microthyrium microscopicum]|uniref:Killer toxin n=1 Tax=Microthyrium microscopicum TaxID=703497 RepID=A0A6A6UEH9_9PEZI|nr:killer toxin [Microthyrium microscopicum]
MHFTTPVLAILLSSSLTSALGINCKGSGTCTLCSVGLDELSGLINSDLSDSKKFVNGDKVACIGCRHVVGGLCAIVQNIGGGNVEGLVVKQKVSDLLSHGCKGCGSCPVFPGNDVSTGEITVNYVKNHCGTKIC